MRRQLLVSLILGVTSVLFLVTAVLTAITVGDALGLAHASARTVRRHVDLASAHRGIVAWTGQYETSQPVLDTWHNIPRLAAMELEDGARSADQCLKLGEVKQFHGVGYATSARLCEVRHGTRIVLNQRIYLWPIRLR